MAGGLAIVLSGGAKGARWTETGTPPTRHNIGALALS